MKELPILLFIGVRPIKCIQSILSMVFILDGCSFHVAHNWWKQGLFPRKKNRIWELFRCKQMPSTNRNTWFTPYVRAACSELPSNISTRGKNLLKGKKSFSFSLKELMDDYLWPTFKCTKVIMLVGDSEHIVLMWRNLFFCNVIIMAAVHINNWNNNISELTI